jgi:hydroxymethylbilane synthase
VTAKPVRIGTRGSQLARAQANLVAEAFERAGQSAELVIIETAGDVRAPDTAWGEGAFVTAIERALRDGRADVAVHSAKDVPTDEDARLRIAAYLPRADPRDALVVREGDAARTVESLSPGARVGTDSPRRTGFLLALRPDLVVHALHGNVDTRLRRLDGGDTDALILAVAGLERLGREDRIAQRLDPLEVPPAPGQGAIAVQVRADDDRVIALAATVDDAATRFAVETERAFLRLSGGGCRAPIGALASSDGETLALIGGYALPDGSAAAVERIRGDLTDRDALVASLVERLAARVPGARTWSGGILPGADVAAPAARLTPSDPAPRVIVTRAAAQAGGLLSGLRSRGLRPVLVPAIEIAPAEPDELQRLRQAVARADWVAVTSANGAAVALEAVRDAGIDTGSIRWAAVGSATAGVLARAGIRETWLPSTARGSALAAELPVSAAERVLLARNAIAGPQMAAALRRRGAIVEDLVAYRTVEAPDGSRTSLRAALAQGQPDAVLFMSGSAIRGFLTLAEPDLVERCRSLPAVCIGTVTAQEARIHGFNVIATSESQEATSVAETVARHLVPSLSLAR